MSRTRVFVGISLTTLAVILLELALTRLFSATMYYHYAFMAISVALFGSGASGVFIYLTQRFTRDVPTGRLLAVAALLFAFTSLAALYIILSMPLTLEGSAENTERLIRIYGATAISFFFAGCTVTIAITRYAKEISRLYLFDLAGAAAGCLLLIPLLNVIGAVNTVLLVSVLASITAVIFAGDTKGWLVGCSLVCAGFVGFFAYNLSTASLDVRSAKGALQNNVLMSKWNSFSRITVEGDLGSEGVEIKIDADAATTIPKNADNLSLHRDHLVRIEALAYHLRSDSKVLIIGPGGGSDIVAARVFGMKEITAVEVNPIIARDVMSSEPFKSYSGSVYHQPGVRVVVDEGRSFIRSSHERYEIIQATMVDTWAATAAGAFALTENNLYTVEAFKDYVEHLSDDGLLTMTRWYFEPPDQMLRLISLIRAMITDLGSGDPSRQIMIVRDPTNGGQRTPATLIFKKSPFTDDEVRVIETFAKFRRFELLYTPWTRPRTVFTRLIEAEDPSTVWESFPTNIAPTRDNNPFFFNTLRPSNLTRVFKGAYEWQKTNLGTFVLFALFGITSVLVAVFILGPLLFARGKVLSHGTGTKLSYLLYFACLGAGFIIVEVAMIQRFILFLGHPVYALAVVLFSLLIFSAAGSYVSGRFVETKQKILPRLLLALVGLVIIYIFAIPPVFYGLVHLALALRIAIAVTLLAPLALLMGMPMPIGIRILSERVPEIIPWAWGVNGAASVTGSVGALALALLTGFNQALLAGAALYLLAIPFVTHAGRQRATSPKLRRVAVQA